VQYWQEIGTVNLKDLVFVDETGSNLAMTRRYARSLKGSRAYDDAPYQRGSNLTLIGAMALRGREEIRYKTDRPFYQPTRLLTDIPNMTACPFCTGIVVGLVGEMTLPGAVDGLAFKTYVTQILVPNLWPGACVVMDNLPAHKVTGIQEAIVAVGATVVYLSPYSPDFSPIENCWSKVKEFLRTRAARTYAELDQAITDALAAVTSKDIIGWFTHCCYYILPN
jgi:transposase